MLRAMSRWCQRCMIGYCAPIDPISHTLLAPVPNFLTIAGALGRVLKYWYGGWDSNPHCRDFKSLVSYLLHYRRIFGAPGETRTPTHEAVASKTTVSTIPPPGQISNLSLLYSRMLLLSMLILPHCGRTGLASHRMLPAL